ncbi:hypothetical protein B7463_g3623, partial [Scytalidium lignicola]
MSADDQAFLDILSSVPNDVRRYSNEVADYIDKQAERIADSLRQTLSSSRWIPESARPKSLPPPKPSMADTSLPSSMYAQIQNWASKHKVWTAVIVVAIGGVTYHMIRRKANCKKRRARRAGNGARLEVVVIAGSPSEPITRSIALDLERRGFIVYVVCNTIEEEVLVHNESRSDIKPLMVDIVDPISAKGSLERFTEFLQVPHAAFQGAKPHHLTFRSLILIPPLNYPSAPIATFSPSTISDLLNTRLFNTILTIQTFLPTLAALPLHHPHSQSGTSTPAPKPSVLVLTPSIIPSLNPAFHALESSIVAGLASFTQVLSAELSPLSIPVTHLQLGTFDFSTFSPKNQLQTLQSQRAETLRWDESARQVYGKNFVALSSGSVGSTKGCGSVGGMSKGSSLRELNNAVFDAMVKSKGGVIRVGQGSKLYGFIGNWVPRGLVGWMLGLRRVNHTPQDEFGRGGSWGSDDGYGSSPGSAGSGRDLGGFGSEYIPVYGDLGPSDGKDTEERFWKDRP